MLFQKAVERLRLYKQLKHEGKYLGIPYPFPRLNEHLSTIDRGQAIGVLGASGIGKSKFTRYTFLYHVYKFYKETGYKVRILWFCMEDSKDQTFDFVLCNYLKDYHGITITQKELNSKTRELPDFVVDKLEESRAFFEEYEQVVTFIDGITEPTELYNICRGVTRSLGVLKKYTEEVDGQAVEQYRYDSDTHVIAVFDNMSNIDTEDGTSNEQAAILKFVKDHMRLKLCNIYKWTCVMVMQSDFETERQVFSGGQTVVAKLEPSLASIGDSKRSSRSFHLVFALFSPHRYELLQYPVPPKHDQDNCYKIDILGNRFRSLRVIKANGTDTGMRVGLLFDGISEIFSELPLPKTPELAKVYESLTGKKVNSAVNNAKFVVDMNEVDDDDPF